MVLNCLQISLSGETHQIALCSDVSLRLTLVQSAFSDGIDNNIVNYARVLCHYGALITEFLDAWRGDGEQVIQCWRVFLPPQDVVSIPLRL